MKLRKEIIYKGMELVAVVAILNFISKLAIDRKTETTLYERAGGKCENCGSSTSNLEVAHIQHGDTKKYNKLSNIKLFCTKCHFFDHLNRGRNNLSKGENDWTLYQLWHRMTPEQRFNIPMPPIPKKNNHYRR